MNDNSEADWWSGVEEKFRDTVTEDSVDDIAENIFDHIFEELVLEGAFEVHKSVKLNFVETSMLEEDIKNYSIIESKDGDIFGHQGVKKSSLCHCPRCQRPLSSSVFTTHLQNCVGIGRSSARIASLRIANNCIRNAYGGMSDEDDDDWIAGPEKAKKKKVIETKKNQDKNNLKRGKSQARKKLTKEIVYSNENSEEI